MSSRTPDNPESFWQSSSVGDNYCTVEKITLPFAKDLVGQARITESADDSLAILDHGCGTGVIALALHQTLSERSNTSWLLTCEDISPSMITQVQARIDAAGWKNTNAAISDLQKTGLPSAFYSHIFASFVFMAIPNYENALEETIRLIKPGGTLAMTTWKTLGWLDDVNGAFASASSTLPQISASHFMKLMGNGEWDNPAWIETQLRERKFEDVEIKTSAKKIDMGTVEQLMPILDGPLKLIMVRDWTEEQRRKYGTDMLARLQKYMKQKHGDPGEVTKDWVAIIITARKPS